MQELSNASTGGQQERQTVLVVEDNEAVRQMVLTNLTALGYHVIEARGGTGALDALERQKIDVLFTDIVMPGELSGIELARVAAERFPGLRVLLTSGFPDALENDAEDLAARMRFLSKPYRRADLARTLEAVLSA